MIGAKNDLHPVPRRGAWLEMKEQAKSALPRCSAITAFTPQLA